MMRSAATPEEPPSSAPRFAPAAPKPGEGDGAALVVISRQGAPMAGARACQPLLLPRRELGLSAGAAQYRKTAAELVQRYPEVGAALRDGRLCLSSVIELAKVMTPENAAEVLPRFFGLSSRDAAFVAASLRPVEDAPRREFIVTPVRSIADRKSPRLNSSH